MGAQRPLRRCAPLLLLVLSACGEPPPIADTFGRGDAGSMAGEAGSPAFDAASPQMADAALDAGPADVDARAEPDTGTIPSDAGNACSKYRRWTTKDTPAECDQLLWSLELSESTTSTDETGLCVTTSLTSGSDGQQTIALLAEHRFCLNGEQGEEVEESFLPDYRVNAQDFFAAVAVHTGTLKVTADARPFNMPSGAVVFALSSDFQRIDLTDKTIVRIILTGQAGHTEPGVIAVKMRWEIRGY